MIKRVFGELPSWARLDHPLLRYELARQKPSDNPRRRYSTALWQILLLLVLFTAGYLWATDLLRQPAGINTTQGLWRTLYFPTLFLQVLLSMLVLGISAGAVSAERRRQTWDNLRATEGGARLTLHTRWIAMFYRLRGLVGLIIALRVVLVIAALYELTSHRGDYLELITSNVIPEMPAWAAVMLMAAQITAVILLPITQTLFEIATGLLLAVAVRNATFSAVVQMVLVILKGVFVVGLLWATTKMLSDTVLALDPNLAWLIAAAFTTLGDQGLLIMQLGMGYELSRLIPYAVLLGLVLFVFTLIQITLADLLIAYAVRRAERTE
jgi:hypothetical protein